MSSFQQYDCKEKIILLRDYHALLAILLLLVVLQVIHIGNDLALIRLEVEAGAWWRLLSGNLVHHNFNHFLLNSAGLCLLWLIFQRDFSAVQFCMLIPGQALLTGLFLYHFTTSLDYYVGLSSVLHGMLVTGALIKIGKRDVLGYWLLLLILLKLLWDGLTEPEDFAVVELIEIPVSVASHVWGAVSGVLAFCLLLLLGVTKKVKKNAA